MIQPIRRRARADPLPGHPLRLHRQARPPGLRRRHAGGRVRVGERRAGLPAPGAQRSSPAIRPGRGTAWGWRSSRPPRASRPGSCCWRPTTTRARTRPGRSRLGAARWGRGCPGSGQAGSWWPERGQAGVQRLVRPRRPHRRRRLHALTSSTEGVHVDRHLQLVLAAAEDHALERGDVGEVAAVGDGDVLVGRDQVVGRVEVDPADVGDERADPGVRGVGADQLRRGRAAGGSAGSR